MPHDGIIIVIGRSIRAFQSFRSHRPANMIVLTVLFPLIFPGTPSTPEGPGPQWQTPGLRPMSSSAVLVDSLSCEIVMLRVFPTDEC